MSSDLCRHALNGPTMGTRWSALFYAPPGLDVTALEVALAESVDRVDRQMSTWKPESDLMRFNSARPEDWVSLPAELMRVLGRGLEIGRASGGAFDIGLGSLVNAWGFGPSGSEPDVEAIRQSLRMRLSPTHDVLELDQPRGRARKHAAISLDLSGIAKGFAVDEMMRTVEAFGVSAALVSLDGEVKACGATADGTPWLVAVEKPDFETRSPLGVIALRDAAVATSGDYRHWVDVGEKRLSHTMDRMRGGPADNGTASVSVITESCMDADAWATALMVLGSAAGKELALRQGLDALFVQRSGDELTRIQVGEVFQVA
ncbi:FAD:protein FMN transferase [Rhizobium sp. ARZ01]|uniref:FAD:protein FMN transferase n=1 Tax=Rhizobium sp. ARZ01 TaxID=2769313 RepID=UPI002484A20C|nr:FAD:protein FMN transferase [Rhizobium sp. ARZ01]